MSVILGIDLGTSSVKAMLLDRELGVRAIETRSYEVVISCEGHAEQNPELWWEKTKEVLRALKEKEYKAFSEIEAIGFSGQMHGLVLTDEMGNAIRPAILWLDQRAKKQVEDIQKKLDLETMGKYFCNRVCTGFAFPSLLWVKENEPESMKKTRWVMLPKDYIRCKMTGEIASDVTDASSTGIFDTAKRTWNDKVIHMFDLPEKIFPKCGEPMEIAGRVTKQCEDVCGLKAGIPVVYGSGDQQAQSIGNGVYREGQMVSNIGTGGQLSTYIKTPIYDKELRTNTFCHAVDGAYTIVGATLCSGMSLNWLKNKILVMDHFDEVSSLGSEISPGADGLIYLPYLAGERTPHMNPNAKGIFFGMTLSHDRRHMIKAVMEGVIFSLRDSLSVFNELDIKCDTMIASGGGAHSDDWIQIQADIFGKKVKVCEEREQACLGACILAGVGAGVLSSIGEAAERFVHFRDKVYIPNPELAGMYESQYKKFRQLYKNNESLM